ncbi:MAG: serine/threonine-protein kinase [Gemmatimonadaceae bacterium]|nr:serine/threonine-protein kinase [Gemmatimonadaceae bacterium]
MSDVLARLGAALGRSYRLDRELGAGGMATVYLAHDIKHDRDVAIKVLHPDLGAALGGERFLSEIRTTARLQHPHILPLLDSGEADGLLYYVMPLVTGETLRARLDRETQLPIADAVRIAREVASALDYAHRQNVIHRDIKPENILLHDGSALVADFGIALAVQTAGGQRMTQTGLSLGTPQYMSPEQAMGERVIDARSDIYALGAVTYEMLTGDAPFSGNSVQAIVAKVLTERPTALTTVRDTVPPHIERAVLTALAKLPADRPATAAAFAALIESGGDIGNTTAYAGARPAAHAKPRRLRVALTAAAFTAVAALAAWGWLRPVPSEAFQVVPMLPQIVNSVLAMSPDGSMYASRDVDSTGADVVLLHSLTGAPPRRVHAAAALSIAFSPNGRQLAYIDVATQGLMVRELASGVVRTLAPGVSARGLTWMSNDTLVASSAGGVLTQYPLTGAPSRVLIQGRGDSLRFGGIATTSDGVLIAVASHYGGGALLVAIREGGRQIDSLYPLTNIRTRLALVGDALLFIDEGRLWGLPLARNRRTVTGARREVLGADGSNEITAFAASQSGSLIALRSAGASERELLLVGRDGRTAIAVPQRLAYVRPRYAQSGNQIASIRGPAFGGPLWVTDLTRGTGQWVGSDSARLAQQWTPDGRRLLIATGRGGGSRVISVAAEGGGAPVTLLERPTLIYELEITPDGRTLVWREDAPGTGRDILMASLDRPADAIPLRVSPLDERGIALSRDGKWLAYTSNESGSNEVYLCRLEKNGARWAVTQGGAAEPRWGASGELFYRHADSVFVARVTGTDVPAIGKPMLVVVVPSITGLYEPLWDVRRDGKQFVMVRQSNAGRREQLLVLNWQQRWRAK